MENKQIQGMVFRSSADTVYKFEDPGAREIILELSGKIDLTSINSHLENTDIHVNSLEKSSWNSKAEISDIKDSIITLTQGGINKGSFTLNQSGDATIEIDPNTTIANLTTITNGESLMPDGHYQIIMSGNVTLNADGGIAGKTGAAELFINPGSYTFTAGTNLTLVNELTSGKLNYCTLNWYGTSCQMYVIDCWE